MAAGPIADHTAGAEAGERMFVWCDGGPAIGRAVVFPPPAEVEVEGGVYVLVDDGAPPTWRYEFVPVSMPG